MNQIMDSHCHWDHPHLQTLQPALWQSCLDHGVGQLLVPGTQFNRFSSQVALCETNEKWHLALGLHPYFCDQHRPEHLLGLEHLLNHSQAVAVGEIGLDFAIDMTREAFSQPNQEQLFIEQVCLASRVELPIIVHCRKANDRMAQILRQQRFGQGGIVHAFSGSLQQAQAFTNLGFKIGLGGTLTYHRAQAMRRLSVALPLADIVLETDAPDMPMAGGQEGGEYPNRPDYLPRVLDVLASLRPESIAQIAHQTHINTLQVLNLPMMI
ncbi:MAG: TatD family hydrolase [Gammaproteobacteria bacterium]|nr:TatD family hydrolase [Gammaproteobacteria bacterium]